MLTLWVNSYFYQQLGIAVNKMLVVTNAIFVILLLLSMSEDISKIKAIGFVTKLMLVGIFIRDLIAFFLPSVSGSFR